MKLFLLRNRSIASRLFLSAAFWSIAILLIAGFALSHLYVRTAEQDFDSRLAFYLKALVADVASPAEETRTGPGQLGEPQFELSLSGWYWQITRLDKSPPEIKTSRSLFGARLPPLAADVPQAAPGLRKGYVIGPDDRRLRMVERNIDIDDDGRFLIQVAATTDDIEDEINAFELSLAVTFAVLALGLSVSTALQLRFGLAPLRRLQQGLGAIRSGESARIEGVFAPDIAPLASELNLLIAANLEVTERARTHVGNLAHGLKTPLSVLVNEADADRGPLAAKVREQARVMQDQIDYYLDRARAAARAVNSGAGAPVEPMIAGLMRAFQKIHAGQVFEVGQAAGGALRFRGEKQDFEEMAGNLIDNAAKWARGQVRISVRPDAQAGAGGREFFFVGIEDDGPGLSAAQREAAVKRGQRLDETKPGSGLGLSIVADLAGLYGGGLTLAESALGGLKAELRLPCL